MYIFKLAAKSLWNRKFTLLLTVLSIAFSIMLLLGVERLRHDARESFANTISGTDLIVGARSGPVQLLLYSVFRIGNPTNNISWESYQTLNEHPLVEWTIPFALGDSHQGFRVLGTSQEYFKHYRYGQKQPLGFNKGNKFNGLYEAVMGADVALQLGYQLGEKITLSHGTGEVSFFEHEDSQFEIVGTLQKTGTPVDRTVHVSLEAIEAIHVGWEDGAPPATGVSQFLRQRQPSSLEPKTITAALVGLTSPLAAFKVQRYVNEFPEEPLLATLPGVALQQLWDTMAIAQRALVAVSIMVVLVGILGMCTAILTSLNERRREMAVLRSVGARPHHILLLFVGEAGFTMVLAIILGVSGLYLAQWLIQPIVATQWGLYLPLRGLSLYEWQLLALAMGVGLLVGLIPALRAYKFSLADGLTIRL